MKKFLLLISFILISFQLSAANLYWDYPGNGDPFYSQSIGRAQVNFGLLEPSQYYFDLGKYGIRIKYLGESWGAWDESHGKNGTLYFTEAGTYELQGRVKVDADAGGQNNYYLYTVTRTIYIYDNNAPSTPSNASISSYNNHPKITWSANSEYDLDYYEVYKKDVGSFQLIATTSPRISLNNNYTFITNDLIKNNQTSLIDSIISETRDYNLKYTCKYENKNLTELLRYISDNQGWLIDSRVKFTYDSESRLSGFLYEFWGGDKWIKSLKDTLTYSNNNRVVVQTGLINYSNSWYYNYQITTYYDRSKKIISTESMEYINGVWERASKSKRYYDKNSLEKSRDTWIWVNGDWQIFWKFNFSYDSLQRKEIVTTKVFMNGKWINNSHFYWDYFKHNSLARETRQYWDRSTESWVSLDKINYKYDISTGNLVEVNNQSLINNEWQDSDLATVISFREDYREAVNGSKVKIYYGNGVVSSIDNSNHLNKKNELTNYPNPFNKETKINYSLSETENVKLTVYDLLGQKVTDLVDEIKSAGQYSVLFDASSLASGTYILLLKTDNNITSKKIIYLK